jgi:chemotaxis protein MotB
LRRRSQSNSIGAEDIWPGFTDALSGLLLVLIFLITIFVVTDNVMSNSLSGRDETISKLNKMISDLRTELSAANLILKKVNQSNAQLKISDLRTEVSAISLMLKNAKKSNAQLEIEIASSRKSNAQLERKLASSRKSNVRAGKKIADLQNSEAVLSSAKDKLVIEGNAWKSCCSACQQSMKEWSSDTCLKSDK